MKARFYIAMMVVAGLILGLQFEIDVLKTDFILSTARPFVPPRARGVRLMAIGYQTLVADMYWIRTIQYRESCADRNVFPGDLYAMGDFITDLDPRYHLVYFFTGLNLVMEGGDKDQIIAILEKGEKNCPTYWKIPFLLGFYYYIVLEDYEHAGSHMELAAKLNGSRTYAMLAARIQSQGGSPELGIKFLQEMIKQTTDARNIQLFTRRIHELQARIYERDLTAKVADYYRARGAYPARIEDLVSAGLIRGIPPHPLPDHRFIYDPDKEAVRSDPPLELQVVDPLSPGGRRARDKKARAHHGGKK